jgi:hypothetical protein
VSERPLCRIQSWVGATVLLGFALAAFGLLILVPRAYTNYVTDGFLYTLRNYGVALPLLGLGFAVRAPDIVQSGIGVAALVVGMGLSFFLTDSFFANHPGLLMLFVKHPVGNAVMCSAAGLALLLPGAVRTWFVPVAALASGCAFGIFITLDSPGDDGWAWFFIAAALSGLMIFVAATAIRHALERPWFAVVGRILGSWLIAIGLMLSGLALAPRRSLDVPAGIATPVPEVDTSRQP